MGYKGYKVTPELVEEVLSDGFHLKEEIEILKGVPIGAKLRQVDFKVYDRVIVLWFEHESFPSGIALDDGEVHVKRTQVPL